MTTNLLLTLATAAAFTASAQSVHPTYTGNEVNLSPNNLELGESSIQRASTAIVDTNSIANAKWSIGQGTGGSYTLAAYPNQAGGSDFLSALQSFPMVGEMDMSAFGIYGSGVSATSASSGNFDVYVMDNSGLVGAGSFTMAAGFATTWFDFDSTFTVTDTFSVWIQPSTPEDSITVVNSGGVSSLGIDDFNGLLNVLQTDGGGATTGNSNYAIAGDANGAQDADWQFYPVLSYDLETTATADVDCIDDNNLAVNFDFGGNQDLVHNYIFNVEAFFLQYGGATKADGRFYAVADYSTEMAADTIDNDATSFDYTFASAADQNVSITEYFKTWGWASTSLYTSTSDLMVDACVTTSIEAKKLNVVWNQVEAVLNFSAPVHGNVNVYSVDGKLVKAVNANNQSTVALNELTAGIYVVEVINNNERSVVKIAK